MITDMMMPVMDGPETIRILRLMNPKLPIIGASGLAATNYAAQLASLGVTHLLSKPYATTLLLRILKQVLDEAGQEREKTGSIASP